MFFVCWLGFFEDRVYLCGPGFSEPGWPLTQRSMCFSLLSTWTKVVGHHHAAWHKNASLLCLFMCSYIPTTISFLFSPLSPSSASVLHITPLPLLFKLSQASHNINQPSKCILMHVGHLLHDSTIHSELGPPTLLIRKMPHSLAERSFDRSIFLIEVSPSQITLATVKLKKKIN